MSDRVGQQFGNYRLVSLLGQGGFAEVYLGQHVRLTLQAAIKVLHTHLTGQEAEHFQQEAETIATLMHPSIVRILDYDVQEGVPFLVMDYAPGGSLRRRYPKGSVVPLPVIVSSVKQVAAALQYAHERKFIHRDVKPENMLIGRHEEVLLSDFGLAALAHSSGSLSTKEAIGTLTYMAPEQIDGHPRAASDQYALGVVVYEWLCGSRPFEGSLTELMVQHLTMSPPPLSERLPWLPTEIEQVVLHALAKDPKARFASVAAFAESLEQASQRTPTQVVLPPTDLPLSPAMAPTAYPMEPAPPTDRPVAAMELVTPPDDTFSPIAPATPLPADVPPLPKPAGAGRRRGMARSTAVLLLGLVVLTIAGGVLGSVSLLAHFEVLSIGSTATTPSVVRGGTWTAALEGDPDSLIPNGGTGGGGFLLDQALYLPLFYGEAQGVIHAGATTEVPTLQNGGISADAKTWIFHLRPHLVWSDGAPYDARDVDFTWKLWLNPKFGAAYNTSGLNLITSAVVSADDLSITFHLKQAFAPFLALWMVHLPRCPCTISAGWLLTRSSSRLRT
jgi:serine/threonine protein kinase